MGIYIKGMEMPTSCADCPLGDSMSCNLMPGVPAWWAEYDQCVKEKRFHGHCPLTPVPPHGDLIDRDVLMHDTDSFVHKTMLFGGQYVYSEDAIKNAPTIIEAEDKE